MGVKVTNNATTTTVGAVSSTALSLTVASGTGVIFPVLSTGDYFYGTLSDTKDRKSVVSGRGVASGGRLSRKQKTSKAQAARVDVKRGHR